MRHLVALVVILLIAQPVLSATDDRGLTVVEKNRDKDPITGIG